MGHLRRTLYLTVGGVHRKQKRCLRVFYALRYCVYLVMASYKLNRTAFKAQTLEEASDHTAYYKKLSWTERLQVSAYLNSVAFNYPQDTPPRMDKTKFQIKSRNE